MSDKYDPDELVGLDMEPEQAIKAILDGAGTEGEEVEMDEDFISDTGVEGGVDEPNESTEEPDSES
jgi:hypothetical protein